MGSHYIHTHAPSERGYGRWNLYNMVAVYEEFTSSDFAALVARYGNRIVQSAAAQIAPMPCLLALTTFTNIVEILNRTWTAQERLFYIVYSFRERLKKLELRRCLVNDTYSSLLAEFANERIRQHGKTTV